jgi:hypothetical protein
MEYRNPKYNRHGTIDCEINHEKFGWIPFTASPDDIEQKGRDLYEVLVKGNVAPYVAPPNKDS